MNIGEIVKPSVERSELKTKSRTKPVSETDAIEADKAVDDVLELSDRAKRQYQQQRQGQTKKGQTVPLKPDAQTEVKSSEHQTIDLKI